MSWKPEFQTDNTGKWYRNGVAFATKQEAEGNASAKAWAWTLVRDFRAVESDEPVNYRWVDGHLEEVKQDAKPE